MATTSLPLATAAAVATILASGTASAAPADQPSVPTTPAQPGATNEAPAQGDNNGQGQNAPGTQENAPQNGTQQNGPQQNNNQQNGTQQNGPQRNGNPQPGVTTPNQPGVTTPNQPGVTTPQPGVTTPNQNTPKPDQNLASPTQPGVTTPRVAPLPVPGQGGQVQPAVVPDQPTPNGQADQLKPGQQSPDQTVGTPNKPQSQNGGNADTLRSQQGNSTPSQQAQWTSPSLQAAPAAPVVQMNGPHTEVGANVDGGGLLPGYVANTHHFSNLDGYVGTVGYSTPNGVGDAGVSVEFVEANKIKVTSYTHATGFDDLKSENYVDTTEANAAKAAVEGWIKQQPGGAAALDAAAQIGRLPQGDFAPQTVNVAGATTQWGGTVQY
ncbi:hypothetical protein [Nocardia sp. MDA0666]|uniref:hypothetical protein n=1 Tax=Nocardia sp. MDA0666 TaxID=2135448 RepID=UPI001E62F597|nr:hypothetical protein [Nocardia sp. MDA0666]